MSDRTTFVIGAGASAELGFPLGSGLAGEIQELAAEGYQGAGFAGTKWQRVLQELQSRGSAGRDIADACRHMARALNAFRSIDDYLHDVRESPVAVAVGKAAIATTILERETGAGLTDPDWDRLRTTWLTGLSNILFHGCDRANLQRRLQQISFIIFNYDRCVEEYLSCAIQEAYQVTREQAASLAESVEIIHPYGLVGEHGAHPFGSSRGLGPGPIVECSTMVRTYTESVEGDPDERIRRLIKEAQRVVFLGFGFLEMNVRLLSKRPIEDAPAPRPRCFATACGIDGDRPAVEGAIRSIVGSGIVEPRIVLGGRDEECAPFMRNYGLTLGFSPLG